MIARLAWWSVLAAIAIIACFAQLDRSARFNPHFAQLVPPAFSGFAAEQRTRQAIAAKQPVIALAEARALVERRPLPADHLAMLAIAEAMSDRPDQSISAIETASLRGWRTPIIQQAVAEAALQQGEFDIAAQRISALFATGSLRESALDLSRRLVTTPEGQAALASQIAAPGHWQDNAVQSLASVMPADHYAATLVLAAEQGATLDCRRIRRVIQSYERDGEGPAAARLSEICPA